jgi:prepilin-type N-terminal cleavage/methylation domain-containing protein
VGNWGRRSSARVRAGSRSGRRGLTLLELAIALLLFALGAGASVQLLLRSSALLRASAERDLALEAAQGVLEALQSSDFVEAFVRFNASPFDDPPLGASPGNSFDAPGLEARPGDPDGLPGQIIFPGGGIVLREDANDVEMGMPRDLNGDAIIDLADHAADYRVLPLRIRVTWTGASGNEDLEIAATLSNDKNVP